MPQFFPVARDFQKVPKYHTFLQVLCFHWLLVWFKCLGLLGLAFSTKEVRLLQRSMVRARTHLGASVIFL